VGFFVSRHLGLLGCNIAIMKRFLPLLMLTGLLFGQDVLLHKSGKNYKGTFLGKVDEKIIFKLEGEKSNSAFSINDVDIVITSRGGIKVELYYPFDIPTKQEYHPKSSYQELPDIIKIILGGGTCYISLYLFYLLIDATKPGM